MPSIDDRTAGLQKLDGYLPLYWDEKTGSLWMEINKFDTEMLYSTGLTAGLGSNDIGLDRGQSGPGRVVKFQRIGPRVLMVQPNYTFRANSTNPDERRAVEDAFAKSILWGFTVARRDRRPRARRRDRLLPARRGQRDAAAAARQLPRRSHAQRDRHAVDQGLSEEHRGRRDPDVRQRRRGGRRTRRRRRPGAGAAAGRRPGAARARVRRRHVLRERSPA